MIRSVRLTCLQVYCILFAENDKPQLCEKLHFFAPNVLRPEEKEERNAHDPIRLHQFPDPSFPIIFHEDTGNPCSDWTGGHWHEGVELLLGLEGSIRILQDGEAVSFGPGQMAVVNSGKLHVFSLSCVPLPLLLPDLEPGFSGSPWAAGGGTGVQLTDLQLGATDALSRAGGWRCGRNVRFIRERCWRFPSVVYLSAALPSAARAQGAIPSARHRDGAVRYLREHLSDETASETPAGTLASAATRSAAFFGIIWTGRRWSFLILCAARKHGR